MRKSLLTKITLVLFGSGLLLPVAARATTFVLMDEQRMMHTSAAVVVGTVSAIESAGATTDGPIYTYVHVQPEIVIKGRVGGGELVLREPGGSVGDRQEWVFGAPEFWVGERSLLFLSRNPDGTLQTHSLSMGKYTVGVDATGNATAVRDFGYGAAVLNPSTGDMVEAEPESQPYAPLLSRLRTLARSERPDAAQPPLQQTPPELGSSPTEVQESFTFLSARPARWFEPDSGLPVSYMVDSTGDSKLGFAVSRTAVDAALAAWTNVPTSSLVLTDGGTTAPTTFSGCSFNRILFNDPYNEISNPSGCGGILAMGGYCTGGGTTVVHGTTFGRIVVGKVMFNNGWNNCSAWNQCNVAEVVTHEIGHTIGLGHSADASATMAAYAHFDGRCAGLMSDDVAAVNFIYPDSGQPPAATSTATAGAPRTPTPTATRVPTRTATPSLAATRTPTAATSPRPTATRTPTARLGSTATPTRSGMKR